MSSTFKVALPASFAGSANRTRASLSPRVQLLMSDLRSHSGRWTVMAISRNDEVSRQ